MNVSTLAGSLDIVENFENQGLPNASPADDEGSQVTGLRSLTLPPTGVLASDAGSHKHQPRGNVPPDGNGPHGNGSEKLG